MNHGLKSKTERRVATILFAITTAVMWIAVDMAFSAYRGILPAWAMLVALPAGIYDAKLMAGLLHLLIFSNIEEGR